MYYDAGQFAFTAALEANWQTIRRELEQLGDGDFIAWPEKYLYGKGWDIFGLYAFGIKVAANCEQCPETTRLVEQIPGLTTAGFSSLKPGTHIAPHTGYPDGLLRCHLGLVVPENCALRVGDETRSWQEGRCLVFDDTTEHEAWNRGAHTRIVLLLDFQAPAGLLSEPPKPADRGLTSLFGFLKKK
ncbi:aspartyl/asparaginyl beta-hydroxylase domain-containing protein [Gloeobacter kilaueensis]|uniref:Aspartyl/asparaginyl beta-hydroxylase n=1 Tax=Gloeobacter kilaueensis (strain ATCC BAA-2537 / CCAP 1431/1 / ULC 316 / JS1) TaxID=1183438 RepID=U5QLE8_GLOK1|nr:aspartyl/asparaginyl beta-hydroxylase domain-containing protein [Gloeobacter kilaueensis]AGY58495.1 aspartyl/asparaginyl beta-hydroxylase [Gloeobacter kilaueensis JS1]